MLCVKLNQSQRLWIKKSNSALCKANGSLISSSTEAHVVSDCETTSALPRVQLCFSCEANDKTLISASSKAAVTSLPTAKTSVRKAKSEAHFGANNEVASLKEKVLHSTKTPSTEVKLSPSQEKSL